MAAIINIPVGTANIAVAPAPIGTVVYGGFPFQITRIEKWIREPILDASGVDYCLSHVVLGVRCVFNPFATATATQPVPGAPGDRIGISLNLLQKLIDQPKKLLQVFIGPDLVLQAPDAASDAVADPVKGARGDANHGPKVIAFRILDIPGLKSAICYFEVECWLAGPPITQQIDNIVLSNRWETTADVDEDWYTTVITNGRMRLRTDLLERQANPTADIFRGSLLPPVLDGFKRIKIDVHQTDDNREIAWSCTDKQQAVNLGTGNPATRIEGSCTSGYAMTYHTTVEMAEQTISETFIPSNWLKLASKIGAKNNSPLPIPKNSFHLRGWGPPGGDRKGIATMLIWLAIDRFSPQNPTNKPFINVISLFTTQFIHEVAVEVRGEMIGTNAAAQTFQRPGPADPNELMKQMNWSGTMRPQGFNFTGAELPQPNSNPPNSGNSRGAFVGLLLAAALKPDFNAPIANLPSYQSAGGDVVAQ